MNRENTQTRTFGGVDMTKFKTIRRKERAGDWNQQRKTLRSDTGLARCTTMESPKRLELKTES